MVEGKKENTDLLSGGKVEGAQSAEKLKLQAEAPAEMSEGVKAVAKIEYKNPVDIIPKDIDGLYRLARGLAPSTLLPDSITDKGRANAETIRANVFWVVQCGAEVGIPATQAIMGIASINGRPCMWGDLVIGLVRKSGLALYITETIEHDGDQMIATCTTKRRDTGEIITRTFSTEDAKAAGLLPGKEKSAWLKYPKRMLQMRARSWCLRDAYSDVLKGMRVVEEEKDHVGWENAKDITPRPTGPAPPPEIIKVGDVETAPAPGDEPDSDETIANRIIDDFDASETVDEIDEKLNLWEKDLHKLPQNYQDLVAGKYEEIRTALDLPKSAGS